MTTDTRPHRSIIIRVKNPWWKRFLLQAPKYDESLTIGFFGEKP